MTRRQLAVPMVAALLGGAVTAAGMLAGSSGSSGLSRQQGLLALDQADPLTSTEIYERVSPGVVAVRARTVQPAAGAFEARTGSEFSISSGSGFVLDGDGRIVTNAHVVSGVTSVQVTFADGRSVSAEVMGKDEETDLAVLAVDPDEAPQLNPLELGDSDAVEPGDQALAIGNPSGFAATAGTGRVAAADQRIEAPGGYVIEGVFRTDAVIEPGTSGGPLLGADGRVIGVTSMMAGDDARRDALVDLRRRELVALVDREQALLARERRRAAAAGDHSGSGDRAAQQGRDHRHC